MKAKKLRFSTSYISAMPSPISFKLQNMFIWSSFKTNVGLKERCKIFGSFCLFKIARSVQNYYRYQEVETGRRAPDHLKHYQSSFEYDR